MATTPNFGWVTPAPTDFVTDLPADFETFADAVDADVQLIKNTADAALPETLIDAAGDLIYGSAADTAARLAIGTAGQVLAVNSGATAPEWITFSSGGMTQIATSTFSAQTNVSFTSIPTTYKDLYFIFENMSVTGSADQMRCKINNSGSSIYCWNTFGTNYNTSFTATGYTDESSFYGGFRINSNGTYKSNGWLRFRNYATTSFNKAFDGGGFDPGDSAGGNTTSGTFFTGEVRTATAITSVQFSNYFSTNISGTITLFGVA